VSADRSCAFLRYLGDRSREACCANRCRICWACLIPLALSARVRARALKRKRQIRTMTTELRDPTDVRRFVAQGACLQRIAPRVLRTSPPFWTGRSPSPGGVPLPPLGFVADVGHMISRASTAMNVDPTPNPGCPRPGAHLRGAVLGKLLADSTFERAGERSARTEARSRTGAGVSVRASARAHRHCGRHA